MPPRKSAAEFYQELLHTLSYVDKRIFRKELRKAFRRLMPEERAQLKTWFRSACVCRVGEMPRTDVREFSELSASGVRTS